MESRRCQAEFWEWTLRAKRGLVSLHFRPVIHRPAQCPPCISKRHRLQRLSSLQYAIGLPTGTHSEPLRRRCALKYSSERGLGSCYFVQLVDLPRSAPSFLSVVQPLFILSFSYPTQVNCDLIFLFGVVCHNECTKASSPYHHLLRTSFTSHVPSVHPSTKPVAQQQLETLCQAYRRAPQCRVFPRYSACRTQQRRCRRCPLRTQSHQRQLRT